MRHSKRARQRACVRACVQISVRAGRACCLSASQRARVSARVCISVGGCARVRARCAPVAGTAHSGCLFGSARPVECVLRFTSLLTVYQKHPRGLSYQLPTLAQGLPAVAAAARHCVASVIMYEPAGHALLPLTPQASLPARTHACVGADKQRNRRARTSEQRNRRCASTCRTHDSRTNAHTNARTSTRARMRRRYARTHAWLQPCARARMLAHAHAQVDARARPRARADVARRSWGMGPRVGGARNGIVETSKHMCPRSCTRERTGPVPRMLAVSARRARVLGVLAGGGTGVLRCG